MLDSFKFSAVELASYGAWVLVTDTGFVSSRDPLLRVRLSQSTLQLVLLGALKQAKEFSVAKQALAVPA